MTLTVRFQDHCAELKAGETVLDALEKSGANVPSSCRAGACQFCMLRVVEGHVPKNAQEGLKESLRQTGHFLSCICRPSEDLVCEPANVARYRSFINIDSVRSIGPDVALVRFKRPSNFEFTPGQFITLKRSDGVARSYSLASSQHERDYFEIHVRKIPGGQLSCWFHDGAQPGDELWLEGPKGDCTYYPGNPDELLTLIGTGTGVAPLYAIVQDALTQGHQGKITLYHGALSEDRFYWSDTLQTLATLHPHVTYQRCVVTGQQSNTLHVGDLKQLVMSELTDPGVRRVYLCGDPGLVRILKKHVFLAGVSLTRIHADPFIGTN